MDKITLISTPIFIVPFILDVFIFPYAAKRNYQIKNRYYRFHQKYGIKRTSVLKILLGFVVIYGLFNPYLMPGELFIFICIYTIYTSLSLITLYFTKPIHQDNESIKYNEQLDTIVGLLTFPFEYLDSKQPFSKCDIKHFKWSWWAFLIPEYWYFKNEILGAGYLSWTLIFFYFLLLERYGYTAIILIISIRFLSGLFGQRLYFVRYGKYA